MIARANDLGLEFPGNISNVKLTALLAEASGDPVPVEDAAPAGPAVKAEEPEYDENDVSEKTPARRAVIAKNLRRRKIIADAKAKAFRTHIVTITNKDNRENDVMTTAYLAFENQHFGLSKLVPLDVPVELEEALIKIAASCTMTMHKDEIVKGRRTGNKVTTSVKKYAISYSRQNPE